VEDTFVKSSTNSLVPHYRWDAMKSQAADREIDDFMTVPRSRPG
jgi:hypothetical protein